MKNSGYIKLDRALNNWEWKDDPKMVALWIHLLINANYKPSKYRGHSLEAGQIIVGINSLAEKTGLSVRSVRTCLDRLKESQETTSKTTNKFTILTIVKWSKYQSDDIQVASETTNQRQTNDKPTTTSKEIKKTTTRAHTRTRKATPEEVDITDVEDLILDHKLSRERVLILLDRFQNDCADGKYVYKNYRTAFRKWVGNDLDKLRQSTHPPPKYKGVTPMRSGAGG